MTTTAAHNSARQYMHHADEDRMQLWRGEQLPTPRQATNGQHSCPQSPQEISKYEGNTYCLPQPSIMTADSTHDGFTPKSSSGLVSRWCVCRIGLWLSGGECSGVQPDKGSPVSPPARAGTALKCTLFSLNPSPAKFRRISHAVAGCGQLVTPCPRQFNCITPLTPRILLPHYSLTNT